MKTYTRGQETFFHRLTIITHNLFVLALCSVTFGFLTGLASLYLKLPAQFWKNQSSILLWTKKNLVKNGLSSFFSPQANFLDLSKANCLRFWPLFEQSYFLAIGGGICFFVLAFLFFLRRGREMEDPTYVRGSQILTPQAFNREYQLYIKKQVSNLRKDLLPSSPRKAMEIRFDKFWGKEFCFAKDKIALPEYALYRHFAVLGSTGVGKTTLINSYLDYCRLLGEKVIIPDINGEYAQRFFKDGDIILSISDPKASYWDFSAEPIPKEQFANFLVPSGSEANAFWWKGARSVLTQLLENSVDGEDLWQLINSPDQDLTKSLSGIARKISGSEGTGQASGVTGSTVLDLGFLKNMNYWAKKNGNIKPFSVYDWAQDTSKNWVFITFSDGDRSKMGPLLKIWINLAIIGLFEKKCLTVPSLNIVVDELNSIGKIELLPSAVERARKYRGKVILGYQSESHLRKIYADDAESIKANTGNKFIFRCPDPQEAQHLSNFLGKQEIQRPQMSTSYGASRAGDRESIGENVVLRNIVLESEIQGLEDGDFYLKSLHMNPVRSRVVAKSAKSGSYQPQFIAPNTNDKQEKLEKKDLLTFTIT